MKPDTYVMLGGIKLERFEVPEKMPMGGEQMLGVQRLVGGKRVIDAMGVTPRDMVWEGIFFGKNAVARADALEKMLDAGLPIKLSWADKSYIVVIERFEPDYLSKTHIPYSICCVVSEKSAAAGASKPSSVDAMMKDDAASAFEKAARTGVDAVRSAVDTVRSAVGQVSNFVSATRAQIDTVLGPIQEARELISSLSTDLSVIGGIDMLSLGVEPIDDLVEAVSIGGSNGDLLTDLFDIDGTLARMEGNLDGVDVAGAYRTVAGGDLYRVALEEYGDATAWVDIARANDLVDPQITGITELRLPPTVRGTDGII